MKKTTPILLVVTVASLLLVLVQGRGVAQQSQSLKSGQEGSLLTLQEELRRLEHAVAPAGTVIAFAGPTPPEGWLVCDGREVRRDQYPNLYHAIGSLYGKAKEGMFKLPDYQGMFLRGADLRGGKVSTHYRDGRVAPSDQSEKAHFLGSVQAAATARPHKPYEGNTTYANVKITLDTHGARGVIKTGANTTDSGRDKGGNEYSLDWGDCKTITLKGNGRHRHHVTITKGGDDETRPVNVSVLYLIKAN